MARHIGLMIMAGLLIAVSLPPAPAAAQDGVLVWRQRQSNLEKPKSTARPVTCTGDVCSSSHPLESADPVELRPGHYYYENVSPGCQDGVVRIDAKWNGSSDGVGVNLLANGSWVGGQTVPASANTTVFEQGFASGGQLQAVIYNQGNAQIDVHRFGRTVGCRVRVYDYWMNLEFNARRDGRYGINVLVDFSIDNQRGMQTDIIAYFADSAGRPLRDAGGGYRTRNGEVSASTTATPGHDFTFYDRVVIFIPYDELHLAPGKRHDLKFRVGWFDGATGTQLALSQYLDFWIH